MNSKYSINQEYKTYLKLSAGIYILRHNKKLYKLLKTLLINVVLSSWK